MPDFLPAGSAAFFVHAGGLPVAVLAVDGDAIDRMDLPTVHTTTLAAAPPLDGWAIFPEATMTVVDGPGDNGYLVANPAGPPGSLRWAEAVETTRGAVVLFLPDEPVASVDRLPATCSGGFAGLIE